MNDTSSTRVSAEPPAAAVKTPSGSREMWIGYACAAGGAILFSTKAIFIKLAYGEGLNAETLLALRMVLSLPFYAAIGLMSVHDRKRQGRPLPESRLALRAVLIGMLGYYVASYTDFLGLNYISAQFERLILFTYPAFTVIFGALFFRQPIRSRMVAGIAISYAGLLLIFATRLTELGPDVAKGTGLVVAAAVAFALYQLFAKDAIGQIGPRLFTCIAMSGAALAVFVQFALTQPLGALLVGPTALYHALMLAIGATVLPSFLLSMALGRVSAQANATIGTLSPVVTIILAVIVLNEDFGLIDAAGTVLVLAGVGWFTLADRRR